MVMIEIRRFFRSAKVLTVAGVVILAIGVGASALALSLLFASSSLVAAGMRHIGYATVAEETGDGGYTPTSWRKFEKLRDSFGEQTFFAAYSTPIDVKAVLDGRSHSLKVAAISDGFFSNFTEPLVAGRSFTSFEAELPAQHRIILGYLTANSLFGAPSRALGQYIALNGTSFEIIGVAPPQFAGALGDSTDAWVSAQSIIPLLMQVPQEVQARADAWKDISSFYVLAASSHISSNELSKRLDEFLKRRSKEDLALHSAQGVTRDPLRDEKMRRWLRLGAFLSCALTVLTSLNYSLLLLARVPRYIDEVRLKRALGANVKGLLVDLSIGPAMMMLVSLIGSGIVYFIGFRAAYSIPSVFGNMVHGSWQTNFLAFAIQIPFVFALTVLVALLPIVGVFKDIGAPRSGHSTTLRGGLLLQIPVIVQIALCGCIWVLSGMVLSSSWAAIHTRLGYFPNHLKVVYLEPRNQTQTFTSDGKSSFPSYAAITQILEKAKEIPGVQSAAFASDAPLEPEGYTVQLQRPDSLSEKPRNAYEMRVSPSYFKTIGSHIVRGRTVAWHGALSADNEIVISGVLARELWPGEDPVDQRVNIMYPSFAGWNSFTYPARVVGVIEDIHLSGPSSTPDPAFFSSITSPVFTVTSCLIVNGTVPLNDLQSAINTMVSMTIPDLKVSGSTDVWESLQTSIRPDKERIYCSLFSALIMGFLAYIGLYGALRYHVQARNREIAIRICLGASPWDIRKIVLWRAAWSATLAAVSSVIFWPFLAHISFHNYLGDLSWSTSRSALILLGCVVASLCVSLLPAKAAVSVSPSAVLKEQ